jgi:alpha-tubulin suppressor-like RCC1 family protein
MTQSRHLSLLFKVIAALACCAAPTPLWAALIAGGELHSIVVRADGTVWAWGADLYGQLGDGMQRTRYAAVDAVRVRGLTNVSRLPPAVTIRWR